ncbi:MAG: DUF3307 domain-containing protein [Dysgonamonadaceae bacterium]|jgi:hypothetical protein|nr:DUF3307 domain-containing protein [Dysgonamonadaceae bacterium]
MESLLILQIIAHFLADFTFQPQRWCDRKEMKLISKQHFYHAAVVFVSSWLLALNFGFWLPALIIAVTHFGLDVLKSFLAKKNFLTKYWFFIDQALHLAIIVLIVNLFYDDNSRYAIFDWTFHYATNKLILILALILCTSPANVFIKKIMAAYAIFHIKDRKNVSLVRAGRIIGTLERILTFVLILVDQFTAVGFIFAAKSILRFRDTDKTEAKTEYLLIGSLLSFGIAILLGIFYKEIICKS